MNIPTGVSLAGIILKNPVMMASGTFGAGEGYSEFMDLSKLGAVMAKGVVAAPWTSNLTPRPTETPGSMLNATDLQNPGADVFLKQDLPFLEWFDTRVVVNVCGHSEEEYVEIVERLHEAPVDFLGLNISRPNVEEGGIAFGTQAKAVEHITRHVRERAAQPLVVKLSPNVTDITGTAHVVEAGGADVLSLIDALTGMRIDIMRRSFMLTNHTGDPSGSVVHLIAVRMVYGYVRTIRLSLIGMGGISTTVDAIEIILAGTTAVSAGTANFYNPCVSGEAVAGIAAYLEQAGTEGIRELIGAVC